MNSSSRRISWKCPQIDEHVMVKSNVTLTYTKSTKSAPRRISFITRSVNKRNSFRIVWQFLNNFPSAHSYIKNNIRYVISFCRCQWFVYNRVFAQRPFHGWFLRYPAISGVKWFLRYGAHTVSPYNQPWREFHFTVEPSNSKFSMNLNQISLEFCIWVALNSFFNWLNHEIKLSYIFHSFLQIKSGKKHIST